MRGRTHARTHAHTHARARARTPARTHASTRTHPHAPLGVWRAEEACPGGQRQHQQGAGGVRCGTLLRVQAQKAAHRVGGALGGRVRWVGGWGGVSGAGRWEGATKQGQQQQPPPFAPMQPHPRAAPSLPAKPLSPGCAAPSLGGLRWGVRPTGRPPRPTERLSHPPARTPPARTHGQRGGQGREGKGGREGLDEGALACAHARPACNAPPPPPPPAPTRAHLPVDLRAALQHGFKRAPPTQKEPWSLD